MVTMCIVTDTPQYRVKEKNMGVFDKYETKVYKNRYRVEILISNIHGGVPTNPKVAEAWLRTKIDEKDEIIADMVRQTMIDRGLDPTEAVDTTTLEGILEETIKTRQLSGFYRSPDGMLSIRGRHVKAMIKEAANIAFPKERWGPTRKGTKSFFAEHVFVTEDFITLGKMDPDYIDQRFVSTWRGTGIQYDEVVEDVKASFTIVTDHEFSEDEWGKLWVTAQHNGLGAARSQGYGTFEVISWDKE